MNALSLLTKGHTFKDMADRPCTYKLLDQRALPKFTGGRRPALTSPDSAPATAQPSLFERHARPAQPPLVEAPKPAEQQPQIEPAPAAQPVIPPSPFAEGAKTSERACAPNTWNRLVSGARRLADQIIYGRKRREIHGTGVQTELALEKVTVLRNDLNEDDLEVVLVERKVGTGAKPLARLSRLEMTGEAWIRLTAPFRKKDSESGAGVGEETKSSAEVSAHV